jgi:hypothetical protein
VTARIIAVLVAAGALAAAAASPGSARHAHALTCSSGEGTITGVIPASTHSCHPAVNIFAVETLSTGANAAASQMFTTHHLHACKELANASVVVRPSSAIAIRWVRGTTWCRRTSDQDAKSYLSAKNTVIRTNGTIVGVTASKSSVLVKLTDGTGTVTSITPKRTVQMQPDTQVRVPISGPPSKVVPIQLAPADEVALAELRQDVVQTGPAQAKASLTATKERAAVVIGDSDATAKRMQTLLPSATTDALTVQQVTDDPSIVATELERLNTTTVFTAGAFDTVSPVWEILRTQTQMPPTTHLVYVAM